MYNNGYILHLKKVAPRKHLGKLQTIFSFILNTLHLQLYDGDLTISFYINVWCAGV